LHNTIKSAHDQGVVFVAAAGNEPVKTPNYPAAYPEVVAVTASDRSGRLASYANRGDFVDAIAPGGGIITFQGQQYYVIGTSTSTAYASGVAAAIAQQSKQTGAAVEATLRKTLAPK
jgi:subtilisin family serine protease